MTRTVAASTFGAGPWYHLGVCLVLYGTLVAAPTVSITALSWAAGVAGVRPFGGEFYPTAAVAATALFVIAIGWCLIAWDGRNRRRLRDLERPG